MLPKALKLDTTTDPGQEYFLAADKLVQGNPKQTLWTQYTDCTEKFFTGIWRSEPGYVEGLLYRGRVLPVAGGYKHHHPQLMGKHSRLRQATALSFRAALSAPGRS